MARVGHRNRRGQTLFSPFHQLKNKLSLFVS